MAYSVAVLMATYNGQDFISDQIKSLASQEEVLTTLYVSDDSSSDSTISIVRSSALTFNQRLVITTQKRCSELLRKTSANNFFHLINIVELPDCVHWVAFSDQDDIWHSTHLVRAINELKSNSAVGYSSSVTAFWPSGRRRFVKKHGSKSSLNHLFESPGPGCSIVLSRKVFDHLQSHIRSNLKKVSRLDFHDWAIFAFVCSSGGEWFIDSFSSLLYRQHSSNVLGVQLSFNKLFRRFLMLSDGWYRQQVLATADFCGQLSLPSIQHLSRLSLVDRLCLSIGSFSLRRRFRDKIILALVFMIMKK